jgi:hypothetical protein
MILIYILIVFFVCLIGYQLFLAFFPKTMIEGMDSGSSETDPSETDPSSDPTTGTDPNSGTFIPYEGGNSADKALSLATQNQYNIEYLQKKIKEVDGVKDDVTKMKLDLTNQQQQISDLGTQMGNLGQQITGGATQEDIQSIPVDEDSSTEAATAAAEADIASE